MAEHSIFCVAASHAQAAEILQNLKATGFSNDDVSAMWPDHGGAQFFGHEKRTKAPEGVAAGASTGGILAGALGWLVGIGALAIPGAGPFIAAGPLMAALSAAALGAALGGVTGALIGMGIPEYEARRFEGKIKEGNILISVHAHSPGQIDRAREIFERCGAHDISSAPVRLH
jgi:ActD protein